jgi:hemerythrin-like domain-containing protein
MIEHRLIEELAAAAQREMGIMQATRQANTLLIDTLVDFFHTYADRTHHGKEEEILFRDLANKELSPEDARLMQELIEEHKLARKMVGELVQARKDYADSREGALQTILDKMNTLLGFYPTHIAKEDKVFFPNSERYFSEEEQAAMLAEFWEFDRRMIHEKYRAVVEALRQAPPATPLT